MEKRRHTHAVQALWQCYHGLKYGLPGPGPGVENAAYIATDPLSENQPAESIGFLVAM